MSNKIKKMRFFQVEKKFKNIILDWFKAEQVKEFYYGNGLKNTLRNIDLYCDGKNNNGEYIFDHWIAFMDDTPFAFLMNSPIDGPYNETRD